MGSPRDREDDAAPAPPTARASGPLDVTVSNEADLDAPATEDGSMAHLLGKVASAPAAPPPLDVAPGTIVDATFRVIRPLGQGGMGVVYLARDLDLQRDVALKVHRASHGLDRLQREAVAMAQLAHPNVLTVHAVGQVNGRLYIAMEYVPGATLRAWLDEAPRGWREIVALMRAAGEGLAAAHAAGFVHRDFKPENVLVGRDGRPRVGDFGLVRVAADLLTSSGVMHSLDPGASQSIRFPADATPASALAATIDATSRDRIGGPPPTPGGPTPTPHLTATGAALGTPAYMAPEQFTDGQVDARADQFAFCLVLHEALAGQRPFGGATYAELRASVTGGAPALLPRGKAPAWLARVLRRGLARDPADRWPDMPSLLAALEPPRPRTAPWLAAGAVALVAGAGVLYVATSDDDAAPSARPAVASTVCDGAGAELDAIWTPARRDALVARFTSLDATIGPDVAARARAAVQAWVVTYKETAVSACRAIEVDRTWPTRIATASSLCLRRGQQALERSLARADRADRDQMPSASGDLRSPFPIDECVDERVLLSDYQTPGDPAQAARVDDLIDEVSDLSDVIDAGRLDEARAAIEALRPEVAREAYPTLTVHLLEVEGELAREERAFDRAVTKFEEGYTTATAAGLEALALRSAYWLIWIHGVDRQEVAAARPWILQALPEAERYGLHHDAASRVYYAAAVVAEIDADYVRAIDLHRQRVAALEGGDELEHAKALAGLGTSLDASGRSDEAIVAYQQGLAAIERIHGAESPQTVWLRANIVIAQVGLGDPEGAVATAERAVALLARTPGVPAIEASNLQFNHGFALQRAGRNAEAEVVYLKVRAEYVDLSGEDSPDVAYIDANLGELERIAGRHDEARRRLEHALAIRTSLFGEDHDEVADVYTHLGDNEHESGSCAKALPWYRKAVASFRAVGERTGVYVDRMAGSLVGLGACLEEAGKRDAAIAAYTEARERAAKGNTVEFQSDAAWALGWALVAARRDAEARPVLVDARALIQDGDAKADEERAKIDRWLAKH